MSETGIRRWQLVLSVAGRDRDQWYLVLDLEDGYVLVTDGRRRPVERPKRKNLRHVKGLPVYAADLAELAAAGQGVLNEQVRASLEALVPGVLVPGADRGPVDGEGAQDEDRCREQE